MTNRLPGACFLIILYVDFYRPKNMFETKTSCKLISIKMNQGKHEKLQISEKHKYSAKNLKEF